MPVKIIVWPGKLTASWLPGMPPIPICGATKIFFVFLNCAHIVLIAMLDDQRQNK
ncbi:MAG: hypothetical protein IPP29_16430 [Bacteroidetes bacterium]|nr:hypothetical protein [Bacteroidota bacterium]